MKKKIEAVKATPPVQKPQQDEPKRKLSVVEEEPGFDFKERHWKAQMRRAWKAIKDAVTSYGPLEEDVDFDVLDTKRARNLDRRGEFYTETLKEYRRLTGKSRPIDLDAMLEKILDHEHGLITPDRFTYYRRNRRRK